MSLYVVGYKPADQDWKAMKDVWDACVKARIQVPKEVGEFFGDEPPVEHGVKVPLAKVDKPLHPAATAYGEDMIEGFDIDLSKLPSDVKVLRVYWVY